jgi:Putative zinc-finger
VRREHDDDAIIGAYLSGELSAADRNVFEAHLLTCDRCWAEVGAGRRGRALAEQAREPAPAPLRERVYAAVAAQRPGHRRRARVLVAAAMVLLAAVAAAVIVRAVGPTDQPLPIAVAVAGYRDDRLPGSGIPQREGPDLSALRLTETGAGTGHLAGQPVIGYAYRDNTGRRLLIYLSDQPFPMPAHADHRGGPSGAAVARHRGVAVLCSRSPHTVLILGEDERLVWQAATTLGLT